MVDPRVESIMIDVTEDPIIEIETLSVIDDYIAFKIHKIISHNNKARRIRDAIDNRKEKYSREGIALLLESPDGLTKQELLLNTNEENFAKLLIGMKKFIKIDNIFTLAKRGSGKNIVYFLDPIR